MSYEKYTTALSMMDLVVAAGELHTKEPSWREIDPELRAKIEVLWDELYTYIFANFEQPESAAHGDTVGATDENKNKLFPKDHPEIRSMTEMFKLNREEIEARLHEIPPTILEQCFPVWIARYLLAFRVCPVRHGKLTTFSKFVEYYGYMVIFSAKNK